MQLTNLFCLFGGGLFLVPTFACGGGVSLGLVAPDGSADSGIPTDAGKQRDCTAAGACGPDLGMPAEVCPDGSTGGNTGRCIMQGNQCAWEIRTCPGPAACFDGNNQPVAAFKTCATTADCVVGKYLQNCCGTVHQAGINKLQQQSFDKCAADRAAGMPACECATEGDLADDLSQDTTFSKTATVACIAGTCTTSFEMGPCAGVTLPSCPRECTNFPETGSCTPGDQCRMSGSKIGDECTCGSGGTWACSPHPPLGTGCNDVCR